ncbi:MAG: tRNA(Ile)-lysidine synthetase, partial [Muribaculaceae bacterium]|nr:tRNA(Ile)-lysidine synthetase [Muribaculaceae bacterium]
MESGRPVIATLSGGADSVALLGALTALGVNCVAAHCNFHLRGEESNRDQAHAEGIA